MLSLLATKFIELFTAELTFSTCLHRYRWKICNLIRHYPCVFADLCLKLYWNVTFGSATRICIASKCLQGVIKTHIWAGRAINICWIHLCVLRRNIFRGSPENNWTTVCALFYFHMYPRRVITKSPPTDSESIVCWADILHALLLLCLYQSELRN